MSNGVSNQGKNDGYRTKILAYLKENSSFSNKASIQKIRDALYQEKDLKAKENSESASIKTVKKNVEKLYDDGLIFIENSNKSGWVSKSKEECIYYKQPISAEHLPLLIEQVIGMTSIRPEEKYKIIDELVESVGKENAKKYWRYIDHTSPEYEVLKKTVNGELKRTLSKKVDEEVGKLAKPCNWVSLSENLQTLFKALDEKTGEFCCKISFKLTNYNAEGERELICDGYEYIISPYFFNYSNGKIWLVGNKEKYDNLSIYPIELMCDIQKLSEKPRERKELSAQGFWSERTERDFLEEHQGATYGDTIPIVLRVKKKDERSYTRIYNTFDNGFYHLDGGTEEYDRILVHRTAYFIANWAIQNYEFVEVETDSVRKIMKEIIRELKKMYE